MTHATRSAVARLTHAAPSPACAQATREAAPTTHATPSRETPAPPHPSRRRQLAAGLALLLAGCVAAEPTPELTSISPASLVSAEGGVITLHGAHFLPLAQVDFDRRAASQVEAKVGVALVGDERVELADPRWLDSQTIEATVPAGVLPGEWTVELTTPRGATLQLERALRVTLTRCTVTWADVDRDGFGDPSTAAESCEPDRAAVANDCDDRDPRVAPDQPERCNGRDDDCDTLIDEEGCNDAGLHFVRDPVLEGNANDFLSASTFGPESLWIAGGSKLFLHEPDAGFVDRSGACPGTMSAVWSAPDGRAFVAGAAMGAGRLAVATREQGCGPAQQLPTAVAGMVGFTAPDGGVQLELVLRDGRRASWDGVGPVTVSGAPVPNVTLVDAHGSAPDALFAVGSVTTAMQTRPVVLRLVGGAFVSEPLPMQGVQKLNAVWAVSPTEAVAVGDTGTVLRRVNGTWERIAPPSQVHYTTVRAFSIDHFFLSTVYGYVREWDGQWKLHYTDAQPVRDLTAWDSSRFWLVGDNGLIITGAP
ncbi:MAG: MopE-related protein [Myxococcota bacterium]